MEWRKEPRAGLKKAVGVKAVGVKGLHAGHVFPFLLYFLWVHLWVS